MFLDYYKLKEQPFGVTPDPRYLYLSPTHCEALASLYCGVEADRGFVALIAQPGMGKTTLLLQLLERLRKSACVAFLFQTQCGSQEFLRYLLAEMGIETCGHDVVQMHKQLNDALVRLKHAGRRFVLVIDEAQNLDDSVLETVRLLSDFETPTAKLMQIILSGQPQLATKLAGASLLQFRQRIAILSRLEPFGPEETDQYINHRLHVAGYEGGPLFTSEARTMIAARSGGIPRNINNLCFNALALACAMGRKKVDGRIVLEVASDLDFEALARERNAPAQSLVPLPQTQEAVKNSPALDFGSCNALGIQEVAHHGPPADPSPKGFGPQAEAFGPQGGVLVRGIFNSFQEATALGGKSRLGSGPLRPAALAASLVLASLFLFPSVRGLVGTQLTKVFRGVPLPVAKSPSLNLSAPGPIIPAAAPAPKNAIAEPAAPGAAPPAIEDVVIEVKPGQTLWQISLGHFGRSDVRLVEEILALNPRITDPDHIETGQRIVLPGETRTSAEAHSVSLAEVEPTTTARN
jgi:general secretion pathway protein A